MTADEFDRQLLWRFRAQPLRIIDGDTMVVLTDTGFRGRHEVHIRIANLNAPELHEPGGLAAQIRLKDAVSWLTGWPLRIVTQQRETVVSEVKSFERYIAEVFVMAAGGELVNVKDLL